MQMPMPLSLTKLFMQLFTITASTPKYRCGMVKINRTENMLICQSVASEHGLLLHHQSPHRHFTLEPCKHRLANHRIANDNLVLTVSASPSYVLFLPLCRSPSTVITKGIN